MCIQQNICFHLEFIHVGPTHVFLFIKCNLKVLKTGEIIIIGTIITKASVERFPTFVLQCSDTRTGDGVCVLCQSEATDWRPTWRGAAVLTANHQQATKLNKTTTTKTQRQKPRFCILDPTVAAVGLLAGAASVGHKIHPWSTAWLVPRPSDWRRAGSLTLDLCWEIGQKM